MKENAPAKNALLTSLYWVIAWLGAFGSFRVMYLNLRETGESRSGGLLLSWIYEIDLRFYCVGAVLSVLTVSAVWFLLLRHCVPGAYDTRWRILWSAQALAGLVGLFFAYFIGMFLELDMFNTAVPEYLTGFFIPYLLYVLVLVVITTVRAFRGKSGN